MFLHHPPHETLPSLKDPRIDKLPYSIRILLECAIRNCDNFQVKKEDVQKILAWENTVPKQVEIPFKPAPFKTLLFLLIFLLITPFKLMLQDQKMQCRQIWS